MKKFVLVAALLAAVAVQPAWAAGKGKSHCASPSGLEAEQALRYVTDLMIVSSMCKDTVYARFRLRNRNEIIHYQRAMIRRLHGKRAFDRWNTSLANEAAQRQAGNRYICRQSVALLKQAKSLDPKGFRAFAAAQAAAHRGTAGCRK